MGKRDGDKYHRVEKDFYPTVDPACMVPEFVRRVRGLTYAEPCWGSGDLEDLLMDVATCGWRSDVEPKQPNIPVLDAATLTSDQLANCDVIITNGPYKWDMLKPLLDHLPTLKPTWLLLPADYAFNVRMGPYVQRCEHIIAVGRLYWQPNKVKGVTNFAWYKFVGGLTYTEFMGRQK